MKAVLYPFGPDEPIVTLRTARRYCSCDGDAAILVTPGFASPRRRRWRGSPNHFTSSRIGGLRKAGWATRHRVGRDGPSMRSPAGAGARLPELRADQQFVALAP
jgi:hypothetical protein